VGARACRLGAADREADSSAYTWVMLPPANPHTENIVIILLAIATGVAVISRWARLPYTVALVVAGLTLGALHVVAVPHLTKELVFAVFLPGLVFEAAFHLRYSEVKRDGAAILALAIPGVGVALALTAAVLVGAGNILGLTDAFDWRQALVFGSLIAATDPIAVVALFRSLGAPQRLATLLEAESLLNDGTAIVFFGLILTAAAGGAVSAAALALNFTQVVGIGAAIGGGLAFGLSQLTRRLDDPMVEITLTAIAAYGSFALAEQLGGSGVIATVVAGLMSGNYGRKIAMTAATRAAVESFWDYVAFLLNSIVFLLIGFEVSLGALARAWPLIALAVVAVLLARLTVVSTVTFGVSRTTRRLPRSWIVPLSWGGLRGALSMVLAISLPADFPRRELLITTTFGVVIVSIVVQGVTMSRLLRSVGLIDAPRPPAQRAR
jgi:CPA1 family monovalent cation:H+ antiporter